MVRFTTSGEPDTVPHIWVGGYDPGGIPAEEFADNILAYAKRHDLTIVLSQWTTSEADAESLAERLKLAKEWGVDAWLGTYDLRMYSDAELVADGDKMEADLERLNRMVDTYAEYYPEGKIFVWHEPPNTGKWTGDTRAEQARSMVENGPEIFSRQKSAVAERYPDLDFGLMLWWPTAAPPGHTETPVCEPLMNRLADRDALPDFTYIDVYRYHFEWDVGHEAVNEHIAATLENIKEHTDDRPVYFLADLHSYPEIGDHPSTYESFPEGNDSYTPSKQALLGHLDASLSVGVESIGWYIGKHYRAETHPRNYEPFVPNVSAVDDQQNFNSVTGSRDRFVWATLALCESAGPLESADRFDLWLYGRDFDFYEHAVELRTTDGKWEFVGDVSGYVDGDNPYSGGDRDRVVAFHALERDRYFSNGELEVRIDSHETGDGAVLNGVYAAPYVDSGHYRTEPELSELVDELSELDDAVLGSTAPATELHPGTETRVDLSVSEPSTDLAALLRPLQRDVRADLAQLEADPAFNPRKRFDLWVYGDALDDVTVELGDTEIDTRGGQAKMEDDADVRVYRGLERSAFFERHTGGHYLKLSVTANDPTTVHAAFAMPYHGTTNFTTDAEVAAIIERDYAPGEGEGMLSTFAMGHQHWPGGADLAADDRLETWVQIPHRQVRPQSD